MRTKTLLCFAAFMLCCTLATQGMPTDSVPWNPPADLPEDPFLPGDNPADTIPYTPTDPPEDPQYPPLEILGSDTIPYIKGECLSGTDVSAASLSFCMKDNTLYIDGTVEANCCGEHHLAFFIMPDSISIVVFDEGELCDCRCLYAVHEQIEGCEEKEYMLGFKDKNTGTEKSFRLQAEDKTGITGKSGQAGITITRPGRNTICITTGKGGTFDLKIFDLSGQLQQSLQAESGEHIDITSLPTGAYMLAVDGKAVRKFIKQ